MKKISFILIIIFVCSCKSVEHVESLSSNVESLRIVDTIYQHDSIFIREIIRGDTVYLTRTEWRDRWRTKLVHDTIHDTQYIEKIIEKPPERYIPKFYKNCTLSFFILIGIIVLYIIIRWYFKIK